MPDDKPLFPRLRGVYWSVGSSCLNDGQNLLAFQNSPLLSSIALDFGDVYFIPYDTERAFELCDNLRHILPRVQEVSILRTDIKSNLGFVPALILGFFGSLRCLSIQCDVEGT